MAKRCGTITIMIYVTLSLVSCAPTQPAATAVPAVAVPPTETPIPPTETPIPPTATPAPPTATPTPEPTATPDVPFEEVRFTAEDGVDLAATLFGQGDVAVLLLHMGSGGATQKSWHPFARVLAQNGYAVLTLDFRGRGESRGRLLPRLLLYDARAAVEFLRGRGYSRFVCMGASMGGTTCMCLAREVALEGYVVISSTMSLWGPPTEVNEEELAQLTMPKLYVYGTKDASAVVMDMKDMHRASAYPKQLIQYRDAAHGTDLFLTPYGDALRQALLDFLAESAVPR